MSHAIPLAILKLYVDDSTPELVELYASHVEKHNESVKNDAFSNAGFDLFVPEETVFNTHFTSQYINMKVKAEMTFHGCPSAFVLHPRSSISKTPLMLANLTGIIDCGYRGDLIGAFRCFQPPYVVEKHTRLLQICHPWMCPIHVELVCSANELTDTTRGSGGFGSTGIKGISTK
jgi:dUTPase